MNQRANEALAALVDILAESVAERVLELLQPKLNAVTAPPQKDVFTPKEAQAEFNIHANVLRALVREGKLENLGKPNSMKIPRWSIEDWIRANRVIRLTERLSAQAAD